MLVIRPYLAECSSLPPSEVFGRGGKEVDISAPWSSLISWLRAFKLLLRSCLPFSESFSVICFGVGGTQAWLRQVYIRGAETTPIVTTPEREKDGSRTGRQHWGSWLPFALQSFSCVILTPTDTHSGVRTHYYHGAWRNLNGRVSYHSFFLVHIVLLNQMHIRDWLNVRYILTYRHKRTMC